MITPRVATLSAAPTVCRAQDQPRSHGAQGGAVSHDGGQGACETASGLRGSNLPSAPAVVLRLFAVLWWLLIVASVLAVLLIREGEGVEQTLWIKATSAGGDQPAWMLTIEWNLRYFVLLVLPYGTMTIMRRILTGRWRFGPRW